MKPCIYIGYNRLKRPNGDKFYLPQISLRGVHRFSRKRFRKASHAQDHGVKLVDRYISFCESVNKYE